MRNDDEKAPKGLDDIQPIRSLPDYLDESMNSDSSDYF